MKPLLEGRLMRAAYSITYHTVHLHLLHGIVDLLIDGYVGSDTVTSSSPQSNSKLPLIFLPISNGEAGMKEAISPKTKPSSLWFSSSSVTASIAQALLPRSRLFADPPALSPTSATGAPLLLLAHHRRPLPVTPLELVSNLRSVADYSTVSSLLGAANSIFLMDPPESLPIVDVLSLFDLPFEDRSFEDRRTLTDSHDLLSSLVPSNFPSNSATPHHNRIPFLPPSALP